MRLQFYMYKHISIFHMFIFLGHIFIKQIRHLTKLYLHPEEFEIKAEAMRREAQLRTANGRDFIWNIIREKFGSSDG
jgi:hypothetical protein